MRFIDLRHLNGPNVFSARPVTVARLELDEFTGRETTDCPGFADLIIKLLPGLANHHCAAGRPGGFIEAMTRGTYFGHVTEHVALELSGMAGREVHLGRTMWAGADGRYDVMMECPADEPAESNVPADLLRLAMQIVHATIAGQPAEFRAELERISRDCERQRLGVSTAAIAASARARGIPVRRVGRRSLLRLGYGRHRKFVCAALTSQSSAVGVDIAADKQFCKQLLDAAGIPVPRGVVVHSAGEAAAALAEIGAPVVVKPLGGSHGANLTIGVRTAAEAAAAFEKAAIVRDSVSTVSDTVGTVRDTVGTVSGAVLVEELVPGFDYRVLVIDGHVTAAAQLRPASVTGDGWHTIAQLVTAVNADPRRGDGHARELTKIKLDQDAQSHLDSLGLDEHSVPAAGQVVTLRRNANLSTGGTSKDVTEAVHPEVADMCRRAAAAAGLDICGIDLRLSDISAPLHDPAGHGPAQLAAVLELNACPGLRMHLSPTEGDPRDVAAAVVDSLYPAGGTARIPVVSVTGTNGKTTTVRMTGHVLRQAGMLVGLSCTDGVFIGGRLVHATDASGPRSAEMVLDDPTVEAAVLETARGGIVRRGLGYEAADVAVVTNISADHLGADCIDDLDELIHVKALVAEEIRTGGSVVLNADDPATASLASRQAVLAHAPVIRMFSTAPGSAIIEEHKAAGGICYEMLDGQLVETVMGTRHSLLAVDEMPGAFGGKAKHVIANALAALAACRALGVTVEDCKRGLATFTPGELNPGRGNVYRTATSPVIVDYGHNAAALAATGQFVNEAWGGQLVAAMTLPGDRRDDLLVQSANAVAAWFGKVVLYEDSDKRGRKTGEMLELVGDALHAARPDITCVHAENPADALRTALRLADGGPVLFVYEKLGMAHDALAAVDAVPWPEASCPVLDIAKAAEAVVADAALAARSPADASADYNAGGTMPGSASTAVRSARAASSARKVSAAARPRR